MDRYLGGEDIDLKVLDRRPRDRRRARLLLPGARRPRAPTGLGMAELLEVHRPQASRRRSSTRCPPVTTPDGDPREPLTCDPAGPLVAEVVKTTTDPYVGRISLVRVFSGTLRPDTDGARLRPRPGRPRPRGPRRRRAGRRALLAAGQDPAHRRRSASPATSARSPSSARAETGDTLSDKDDPLLMEPWVMPEPLLPVAIVAKTKADEDKLVAGPRPARRRGPDAAARAQPRDPPARAVVHGRGAPRRAARPAAQPVRRRRRVGAAAGAAARDVRRHGQGPRPARQAVRRARPVRRLRHRGRAAAAPGPASSSSTRSSAAPCRGSSSPRSRRACAPRWSAASRPATPSSTSG